MSEDNDIPRHPCPYCGYVMDTTSTLVNDHSPSKGDVTICLKCSGICLFDEKMVMQKPTLAELREIKSNWVGWRQVLRVRAALNFVHGGRPRP